MHTTTVTKKQPIGIFDSGIGGTSIWKEIHALLPNEETIYLSDSFNAPYGQQSKEKILELSIKNTEFLVAQNCKLIVVACNTATTNAISYLRANYSIPFIGIEPAIKPASILTKSKKIGILATKGTLNSELFEKTSSNIDKEVQIIEQVGEGLVELIENNKIDSQEMHELLTSYLAPMVQEEVDCLVLGCTHYPYLIPKIKEIIGNNIQIIDSGEAVAKQTKKVLLQRDLLNDSLATTPSNFFYINNNKTTLENILKDYPSVVIEERFF
ncbi:glutamate racemase [Tenacibaculum amylolyticum]|uniref:glutamate racemase n=1 Tax=Tenacibaculum amylolyticum TaxID=104269 RepID=UPI0038955C11